MTTDADRTVTAEILRPIQERALESLRRERQREAWRILDPEGYRRAHAMADCSPPLDENGNPDLGKIGVWAKR